MLLSVIFIVRNDGPYADTYWSLVCIFQTLMSVQHQIPTHVIQGYLPVQIQQAPMNAFVTPDTGAYLQIQQTDYVKVSYFSGIVKQ